MSSHGGYGQFSPSDTELSAHGDPAFDPQTGFAFEDVADEEDFRDMESNIASLQMFHDAGDDHDYHMLNGAGCVAARAALFPHTLADFHSQ